MYNRLLYVYGSVVQATCILGLLLEIEQWRVSRYGAHFGVLAKGRWLHNNDIYIDIWI